MRLLFVGDNLATVAETDDEILVEVKNDAGVTVGSELYTLTEADINATRADIDVEHGCSRQSFGASC